jgi:hypothetical protein
MVEVTVTEKQAVQLPNAKTAQGRDHYPFSGILFGTDARSRINYEGMSGSAQHHRQALPHIQQIQP